MRRVVGLLVVASLIAGGCGAEVVPTPTASTAAIETTRSQGPASVKATATATAAPTPTAAATSRPVASTTPHTTATPTRSAAPATSTPRPSATTPPPTLRQLIGQKLVVRMDGVTPSADILGRIRRGEVGGIILFGSNITTRSAVIALTTKLQAAATAGHQPRLLIAVDQEGGPVKRIAWAPPTMSAPQMGRNGLASVARSQGASTGSALHGLGIDVDFAPVADVPATTSSFMYLGGRTFSFSSTATALLADAFASGLESKGVVPSMKHFPGIGLATRNTDAYVVTIGASKTRLDAGLKPYRTAIGHHIPLIMLSNATYTAYDATNAAGWSRAIGDTLLRRTLGFKGATITDSLSGTAHARHVSPNSLAVRATKAGTDMILVTDSEATTRSVFDTLLARATAGSISRTTLRISYGRILRLKAGL